jgi:hypothetical protein
MHGLTILIQTSSGHLTYFVAKLHHLDAVAGRQMHYRPR